MTKLLLVIFLYVGNNPVPDIKTYVQAAEVDECDKVATMYMDLFYGDTEIPVGNRYFCVDLGALDMGM